MTFVLINESGAVLEYPYSEFALRRDNPNTSFPKNPKEPTLNNFNVFFVKDVEQPTVGDYEVVREGTPELINGNWLKTYTVQPMFTEYVDHEGVTQTVQMQIDAYEAVALAKKREGLVVTMRQARLALAKENKLQLVNDAIALIPEPDRTTISIEWEYASTVERLSPWIDIMASALGMTDVEMDALFELAATL
jgi:hypothetical protein